MQRAVNIFFSQHLCHHHHHPDQIATFLLTTTTGFGRPLFHNKNLVLAAEVFKISEIVFSPSVALVFFCAPSAAWEAHFLFFQHLCGERDVFFENRFVRKSVESSKAIFGNLHVFAHTKKNFFGHHPKRSLPGALMCFFLEEKNMPIS